jgi:hypothetical protein
MIFCIPVNGINSIDRLAAESANGSKQFNMTGTVVILTVFLEIGCLADGVAASGAKEVFRMIVLAVYREV